MTAAMIGAAIIGGQYIAGKAARDALFLAAFDPSLLPRMIIGTSLFSIAARHRQLAGAAQDSRLHRGCPRRSREARRCSSRSGG
jgi:hypothetical protein